MMCPISSERCIWNSKNEAKYSTRRILPPSLHDLDPTSVSIAEDLPFDSSSHRFARSAALRASLLHFTCSQFLYKVDCRARTVSKPCGEGSKGRSSAIETE